MELDRQAIERRDFPIGRRGYDTAAVDAHLRAVAAELAELQRTSRAGGADSLATTASSQVQSIIAAAETAAAEIESQAQDAAREAREAADRDARATREEAIAKARAHVAAVSEATAALLERVGSMDAQARALVDSLREGADRLAGDLSALDANMGELYDAASATTSHAVAGDEQAPRSIPAPSHPLSAPESPEPSIHLDPDAPSVGPAVAAAPVSAAAPESSGDLDGARLVALNMALNGESRAETERYLAENFELPDRMKLVDEVYAAIEG